jgi:hypothetical protein
LLALVAFWLVENLLTRMPLPVELAAPYAPQSLILLGVLAALGVYAFRTALGRRPLFSFGLED